MLAAIPEIDDSTFATLLSQRRAQLVDEWATFQANTPLVITPVMTQPTYAAGADLTDPLAVTSSVACVPPINLLGLPAAVVPAGMTSGLPIGVQLVGPAWREDVCLAAASVIEGARSPVTPIDPN
jgi:amidase